MSTTPAVDMKEELASDYLDVHSGDFQDQNDCLGERHEDIESLDSKQAAQPDGRPTDPEIMAEMKARTDKLKFWKLNVSFVVSMSFIFSKALIRSLALSLYGKEASQAIRDCDTDRFATAFVTDRIVDIIAHTGLTVWGLTIFAKQLPDDVEGARRLLGIEAARHCWPVQKQKSRSWWHNLMSTGKFDLQGLRDISWVQKAYCACIQWMVLHTVVCPQVDKLYDKLFPAEANVESPKLS